MDLHKLPVLANKRQVNATIDRLEDAGARFVGWTKDGQGDSDKVEIELDGVNWLLSVCVNSIDVACLEGEFKWYGDNGGAPFPTAAEAVAFMRAAA